MGSPQKGNLKKIEFFGEPSKWANGFISLFYDRFIFAAHPGVSGFLNQTHS
jgi:hypothetical protein